ncbi:MAG TPA: molybdopterin oxidoreductase, partial [Alcanivorax sp.]|nr:molybdopterin oxidoreductase [Alcanivorax sp.]
MLGSGPAKLVHARHAMGRRRPDREDALLNRLYSVESTPSITGASSDHRLPLAAAEVPALAAALAARLGVPGMADQAENSPVDPAWLDALADDLRRAGAEAVVIPGDTQPAALHALAHAINHHLGAAGTSVEYSAPVAPAADGDLADLSRAMGEDRVDALLMLNVNPVYNAPA